MINEKAHTVPFELLHNYLKGIIERLVFDYAGSWQNAKDTSQEIFLRLWLHWERLSDLRISELGDYVYIMTRNYLVDEGRIVKKQRKYSKYYTACVSELYWHDNIILKEGFCVYRQAERQLPLREKVVYFFYKNGCSCEDIAEMVRRSVHTVNNQLRSASQKVKNYLNKSYDLNINKDRRQKLWASTSLN